MVEREERFELVTMQDLELHALLIQLLKEPRESEWLEVKCNNVDPVQIGQYISALSNSAAIHERPEAFMIWGIKYDTKTIVGTSFDPFSCRVGNQALEMWLTQKLRPAPAFRFYAFEYEGKKIVSLSIRPIKDNPVKFDGAAYIRIGSHKTKLDDHSERLKDFWRIAVNEKFEGQIARSSLTESDVLHLLDYPSYFELINLPLLELPGIIERLISEKFIIRHHNGFFDVTNLGALLFAKDLKEFSSISRKSLRIIFYRDKNRTKTDKEREIEKGYAAGFKELMTFLNDQLPSIESINTALRQEQKKFPVLAIRELVANALIHQDLTTIGDGPMVEIFSDRIEITNPGTPLVDPLRFIDGPPRSRNELMASAMRRFNICEERGSGIDKVVDCVETEHLPAPEFSATSNHLKVKLFARKPFSGMDKSDRTRACYQHASLCHVSGSAMTNSSLRTRFDISEKNYPMASRVITETVIEGLIKPKDPNSKSRKYAQYIPFWA
jgi:ATP-dependent DNA helicase RecG